MTAGQQLAVETRQSLPRTIRMRLRFWLDSDSRVGMEAATSGPLSHRTLWQSEESRLRRHGVPRTDSLEDLRRANWALQQGSHRIRLAQTNAASSDAWRAGKGL